MKSPFVNELEPNQTVQATFLVLRKEIRQKKTGEPYLSLLLADKTGDLDTKMWDNAAEVMDTFDRDDFVRVKGLYQIYQNRPQLTVHKLQRVDEREVDFKDYFPASQFDPETMFAELQGFIAEMKNPHLRALLDRVFADAELTRAYKLAPAAKQIHHAWLSGLLEHVLSLARLAKAAAAHYPFIDGDLLLAGVVLHDIGKVAELVYDRSFSYSDEGQLLGHIYQGAKLVSRKIQEVPGFPPRLEVLVEHMILSHHGALEFGSPKVPLFAEALLLHHLDNLDSKMEVIRAMVANDKNIEGQWTSYNAALDRAALKKDRYLHPPAASKPAAPPPPNGAERPGSPFASKLQAALKSE
jgi:3'-5' exoribonuclease